MLNHEDTNTGFTLKRRSQMLSSLCAVCFQTVVLIFLWNSMYPKRDQDTACFSCCASSCHHWPVCGGTRAKWNQMKTENKGWRERTVGLHFTALLPLNTELSIRGRSASAVYSAKRKDRIQPIMLTFKINPFGNGFLLSAVLHYKQISQTLLPFAVKSVASASYEDPLPSRAKAFIATWSKFDHYLLYGRNCSSTILL